MKKLNNLIEFKVFDNLDKLENKPGKTFENIKMFDNFDIVNEDFLGISKTWNKIKKSLSTEKAAKFVKDTLEKNKDNPEIKAALDNVRVAFAKLTDDDKKKLNMVAVKTNESNSSELILENKNLLLKIVNYVGMTTSAIAFVGVVISVAKLVLSNSNELWFGGMTIGTIGAICMVVSVVAGVIGGSASAE